MDVIIQVGRASSRRRARDAGGCGAQVFPDDFHLQTLETYLSTLSQLQKGVNVKNIIVAHMNRLSNFAKESRESIPSDIDMFPMFLKYSSLCIEGSKMPLGARGFASHAGWLVELSARAEDVLQLQVALIVFASSVYPERVNYIDHVLNFTAQYLEKSGVTGKIERNCEKYLLQLLSGPLDSLSLRVRADQRGTNTYDARGRAGSRAQLLRTGHELPVVQDAQAGLGQHHRRRDQVQPSAGHGREGGQALHLHLARAQGPGVCAGSGGPFVSAHRAACAGRRQGGARRQLRVRPGADQGGAAVRLHHQRRHGRPLPAVCHRSQALRPGWRQAHPLLSASAGERARWWRGVAPALTARAHAQVFGCLSLARRIFAREEAEKESGGPVVKSKKVFGFVIEIISVLSSKTPETALRLFLQAATVRLPTRPLPVGHGALTTRPYARPPTALASRPSRTSSSLRRSSCTRMRSAVPRASLRRMSHCLLSA
jgi:hypothetical protein